ncbi:DUF6153 family protein [Streptomyces sp. NBC_01511]|uniref:DUF6153 family protein n=1 Tax=Streptomyces sp. NBC_01511 TaxID=2903889 RepID=UPI00386B4E24
MDASGYGRVGSAVARLLLVVVLALGVFAMHTVGHPDEAYGATAGPGAGAGSMAHASAEPAPPPDKALPHPAPADGPFVGLDGMGMDMASLCVAVLTTWAFVTLLLSALARRPGRLTDRLAGGSVTPRSNSPPRTPELTLLSVLRI